MWKSMKLPLALLSLLLTSSVFAADCWQTAMTTMEMRECANQYYEKADKKLNQVYQKLIKSYSSHPDSDAEYHAAKKATLIKAELDWLQFKKSNCEYWVTYYGNGSMGLFERTNCHTSMIEERTKELEVYLKRDQEQ